MKLIVFFNGWGMDDNSVKILKNSENYEIRVVNFPYDVDNIEFGKYEKIYCIGWSFGCYYMSKYIFEKNIENLSTLGINGNGEIIGRYGINRKMFELTLNTLTPQSLIKFYDNMEIGEKFIYPKIKYEDAKAQLEFFEKNYKPLDINFDMILIGKRDKIVPRNSVIKYCENKEIDYKILDFGHYPFEYFEDWKEIVELINKEEKNEI